MHKDMYTENLYCKTCHLVSKLKASQFNKNWGTNLGKIASKFDPNFAHFVYLLFALMLSNIRFLLKRKFYCTFLRPNGKLVSNFHRHNFPDIILVNQPFLSLL